VTRTLFSLRLQQHDNLVKMVGKKVQRATYLALISIRGRVTAQNATDVLQYVDPLIGSANGGLFTATLYSNHN
jgi:hypothetical protein